MPEESSAGRPWRESLLKELDSFVEGRRREADNVRIARNTLASPSDLRRRVNTSLGWPLNEFQSLPQVQAEEHFIQEDALGKIFRLRIETLPGLTTYALLCLPPGNGPFPAVIAQHGGRGTPELLMGLTGNSANYRDFGPRLRSRNFAVLAPQLCLFWAKTGDRSGTSTRLKILSAISADLSQHWKRSG